MALTLLPPKKPSLKSNHQFFGNKTNFCTLLEKSVFLLEYLKKLTLSTEALRRGQINVYPNIRGSLIKPAIQVDISAHVIMKLSSFMILPHLLFFVIIVIFCHYSSKIFSCGAWTLGMLRNQFRKQHCIAQTSELPRSIVKEIFSHIDIA